MIDLLSDTVTIPTSEMTHAMLNAKLGDDVYGEDPTINELEELSSTLLGKENSAFFPSGTMANLASVLTHCPRGSELLIGDDSDMYHYEAGGPSALGGIVLHPVKTLENGEMCLTSIESSIRKSEFHQGAPAACITLENPQVKKGGRPISLDYLNQLSELAKSYYLPIHMDGARIFNAAAAQDVDVKEIAKYADSVQFCLSKSLAAPVGSIVSGSHEFINEVKRWRKMLGGGMRQAGILAAAGIVALKTMAPRLSEDHSLAKLLARKLMDVPGVRLDLDSVQTNMVFFELNNQTLSTSEFLTELKRHGIRMGELGQNRIRAVIHYQITESDIEHIYCAIQKILK